MATPSNQEVDKLFEALCDLSADARQERLATPDLDVELRKKVEKLLEFYDEPGPRLDRMVSPDDLAPLAGPPIKRLGRFQIERMLGEGGMGIVYLARRDPGGERVALKVLRAHFVDDHVRTRFRREAEVLARLEHPGICRFLESGEERTNEISLSYLAMEFVEGSSALDHARENGLDDLQRIELIARVADALDYAHESGVIHRDIKPNNVLVAASEDAIGQPKVLDFGVAQASGDLTTLTRTATGALIGTVAYMSPEQASGSGELGPRSDVYSLGVLLYELLAEQLPYALSGRPVPVAVRIIQEEEPQRLGSAVERLNGPIDLVVAKALEKEPRDRYSSAAAFALDLRRLLAGKPIEARPRTLGRHALLFVRRYRVLTATALGTMLALLVGIATTLWFALGQTAAREESERIMNRASLRTVTTAIEAGNARIARGQLNQIRSDQRDWEWRHLMAMSDESQILVSDFWDTWPSLFHDDNGRLITAESDSGQTASWDLATGELVEKHQIEGLIRSADAAAGVLLTDGGDLQLVDFDGRYGATYELPPGAQSVNAVMGDPVAVALQYEDRILFFDTLDGSQRWIREFHWEPAVLSPSRRWLAGAIESGFLLWDLTSDKAPWKYLGGSRSGLAISKDELLAFPDKNGVVAQWDLSLGSEPVLRFRSKLHTSQIRDVDYSPDGRLLATCAEDGSIRILTTSSGEAVRLLIGHESPASSVCFLNDSQRIATWGEDGTIRTWNAMRDDPRVLASGAAYLYVARFEPSGERVYIGTPNGELLICDALSGTEIARISLSGRKTFLVNDLAFDGAHGRVIVSSQYGDVTVLNRATGSVEREFHFDSGVSIDMHPRGGQLALLSASRRLNLIDSTAWQTIAGRELDEDATVCRFGPMGRFIYVGFESGTVLALDASTLETRASTPGYGRVRMFDFNQPHRWISVATHHPEARVLKLETLEPVATLDVAGKVYDACFSLDGTRLVTGSIDGVIRTWETDSWTELAELRGHTDYVYEVAFSPDGETLLSAGGDGSARFWRTRSLQQQFAEVDAFNNIATRLAPLVFEAQQDPTRNQDSIDFPELSQRERQIASQLLLRQHLSQ